jgi:Fur family transcriptional regulator, stress-responsive regulator
MTSLVPTASTDPSSEKARVARLRSAGLRVTAPRLAVLAVLDDAAGADEHLSAAVISSRVREQAGSISTQGVYDCLDVLVDGGLLRRIEPAGQPALYEARVHDNHHHLVCRTCGRVADVPCVAGVTPCLMPAGASGAEPLGFEVDEAEITFWGTCAECAALPAA